MTQTLVSEPTTRQIDFLTRLLNEADELLTRRYDITMIAWPEAAEAVRRMRDTEGRTRKEVSTMIDTAMDNNKQLREELVSLASEHGIPEAAPSVPKGYVTTGMYRVGDRVFKVLPSRQSERHYAKELVGDADEGFSFIYAKGAMKLIGEEHRMTTAQAAEFGQLTGACCCCGNLLTDPQSIADGIGPVCKRKYF